MNPSAGGFLGSYKDASNGDYANIKSSLNFGPVLSRDTSGGFIGHLYDDDLDVRIIDCGNLGSVAAPDSCGGLIGSEDSVKSLLIENC
ncbi:MAG: hypothetical protein MJ231_05805, partial [bacterium]|nr:hypothetical protein [bacterium]